MPTIKGELVRLAGLSRDARVEILDLVGSLDGRQASSRNLKGALIRLAYFRSDRPWLQSELVRLAKGGKKETFDEWVKGKKFRNPDTGNRVTFKALKGPQQKKIREHWGEKDRGGTDEDKEHSVKDELLKDYNMSIVGDNEARAAYVAQKIQDGIDKSADICKLTPPVCASNLGISRDNMPQVLDKPIKELLKGDEGDKKKAQAYIDAGGDPDDDRAPLTQLLDALKEEGVKQTKKSVPVGKLKATQQEIKAGKAFGMANAYYEGKFDPSKNVEIVISKDGHILDGHHRWASLLIADPSKSMECVEVDMTMKDFLRRSFEQPGVFRADIQDNIVSEDTPIDLGDGKPFHPKRKGGDKKVDKKDKAKKKARLAELRIQVAKGKVPPQFKEQQDKMREKGPTKGNDPDTKPPWLKGKKKAMRRALRQARLEQLRARVAAGEEEEAPAKGKGSAPTGKLKEFLDAEGTKKVRNPDTGNQVQLKSLKGERGKALLMRMFKQWMKTQDKGKGKGKGPPGDPMAPRDSAEYKKFRNWAQKNKEKMKKEKADKADKVDKGTKKDKKKGPPGDPFAPRGSKEFKKFREWAKKNKEEMKKDKAKKKARLAELRIQVAKGKVPEAFQENIDKMKAKSKGKGKDDEKDSKPPWLKDKKGSSNHKVGDKIHYNKKVYEVMKTGLKGPLGDTSVEIKEVKKNKTVGPATKTNLGSDMRYGGPSDKPAKYPTKSMADHMQGGKKANRRLASHQHTAGFDLDVCLGEDFIGAEHGFDVEF